MSESYSVCQLWPTHVGKTPRKTFHSHPPFYSIHGVKIALCAWSPTRRASEPCSGAAPASGASQVLTWRQYWERGTGNREEVKGGAERLSSSHVLGVRRRRQRTAQHAGFACTLWPPRAGRQRPQPRRRGRFTLTSFHGIPYLVHDSRSRPTAAGSRGPTHTHLREQNHLPQGFWQTGFTHRGGFSV